jgi:peptide-methionine (S)-S-oxide reductase
MAWEQKLRIPEENEALPGRAKALTVPERHFVNGHAVVPPFPAEMRTVVFALGCFWGAERRFWETEGVYSTAVGYAGGVTTHPTYEEVCSGLTGHTEVVLVVFDPRIITFQQLLKVFWESHDPTQGMRQGNDVGTQYRSAIYVADEAQAALVDQSRDAYQRALDTAGYGRITTEIGPLPVFYYAEPYHQQYLAKIPNGYCALDGTGVGCDVTGLVKVE